jgi:hypothetical protein
VSDLAPTRPGKVATVPRARTRLSRRSQWNDIDWMRHYREFQFDQNYSPDEYKAFVDELHSNNQHYVSTSRIQY